MKPNYFLIPLVTLAVAVAGSWLTSAGVGGWYKTIKLPPWTPPGSVIGAVWTTIFILSALAALLVWNSGGAVALKSRLPLLTAAFLLNAALNVLWSLLFFRLHLMYAAGWEAAALGLSVIALVVLCWPISRAASILLLPYAAWASFATYLTFTVWRLNA